MAAAMVVGVDTHKETHSAAVVDSLGSVQAALEVVASTPGYAQLLTWARANSEQRVWAVEGTGSYGAGLATFLANAGEDVYEGDHPKRPQRNRPGKSDQLDAIRVAREALARPRQALPRRRQEREMLRVLLTARERAVNSERQGLNQLYALVVTAPSPLRERVSKVRGQAFVRACLRLRVAGDPETKVTISTLRSVASRVHALRAKAELYERQLIGLVSRLAPTLLAEYGVGALTAAQILVSWSHAGRIRDENAFAALAGVAPVPASSGKVQRHRLNRMGDRRLNRALHTVALIRSVRHEETRVYITRRRAEGKSLREIRRCLKRNVARRLFRLLEGLDRT